MVPFCVPPVLPSIKARSRNWSGWCFLVKPALLLVVLLSLCPSWSALINVDNATDLRSRTPGLTPGDTLLVAPGTYDVATWDIAGLAGTPDRWIVIKGSGRPVVRSNSGCCNLVQLSNVHYLEFTGFELTMAADNPGIDGINVRGAYNSHLVFDSLYIHGLTNVGIGMWPDSAAHITLRNSRIAYNTGSGLYWGYPGRNIVHDVLIEKNYIHHCPADSLQDTHYGIQWKGWCYRAVIQDNVLHDVGGTTRCGIVVYYGQKPLKGDLPADVNVVRRNVLWNCRNEGITVMSDALIENNIVFDAGVGINIQQYSDESFTGSNYVENLTVRNNTVFRCRTACLSIGGWGAAGPDVSLTGNLAYQEVSGKPAVSGGSLGSAVVLGNYYYGQSAYGTVAGFTSGHGLSDFAAVTGSAQVPQLDFYPAGSAPFIGVLSLAGPADDFNGTGRISSPGDAGAYAATQAQNPGWTIQEGFKQMGTVGIRWDIGQVTRWQDLVLKNRPGRLYSVTGTKVLAGAMAPSGIYLGLSATAPPVITRYLIIK